MEPDFPAVAENTRIRAIMADVDLIEEALRDAQDIDVTLRDMAKHVVRWLKREIDGAAQ